MAYSTIDIGGSAESRASESLITTYTRIWRHNACNANGVITSIEIYSGADAITGLKVGTFFGSGDTYTNRDYESLGSVDANTKATFTGLNIACQTNDVLGIIATTGKVDYVNSGGSANPGLAFKSGDFFGAGEQTGYTQDATQYICSLYATGVTAPDAPTDVSATDNLTDKVTITCTAGVGETGGHRFYRDGVDISGVVAHGTATYDDTTGTAGVTYSYTVKAINDAGLSDASTADNGTKTTVGPSIPMVMANYRRFRQ